MKSAAHQNAIQGVWYQKLHKDIKMKTLVQVKFFMEEELETVSLQLGKVKKLLLSLWLFEPDF